jgi:hypothetical protein
VLDDPPEPVLDDPPDPVLGILLPEPVLDDPKLVFDVPPLKPPYVVSWSPPMPRRSRPNDCQAQ